MQGLKVIFKLDSQGPGRAQTYDSAQVPQQFSLSPSESTIQFKLK
jgi:hypothetical protein